MVDADLNQATFQNISNFSQFFLASTSDGGDMDCQTDVYYENTIAVSDTTKSANFIEAGNLNGQGDVLILASQIKIFQAPDIMLKPGFHAQAGSDFLAKNGDCTLPAGLISEMPSEVFSIKEKKNNRLSVFPNPSSEEFTITFSLEYDSKISLELFDVLGQNINTILSPQQSSAGVFQIDYQNNNLKKGTYILLLRKDDEKFYQKIIIH